MAEDDIIELTDIVKEGHAPAQAVKAPASSPAAPIDAAEPSLPADFLAESAADGVPAPPAPPAPDFGADLDALLHNYDEPQPEVAVAAPPPGAGITPGGEAVAAPIANQDDSGRAVDPNEELDLPPLSDLDALLEELGVQDSGPSVAPVSEFSIGDDLDAMPASRADAPAPAGSVAPEAASAPSSPEVDLAAVAAGVAAAKAAPPAQEAPQEEAEQAPLAAPSGADDGIDLNELDALLDSVLSAAPKPKPAPEPASAPEPPVVAQVPEPAAFEPAPALAAGAAGLEALQKEIAALRAELSDLKGNIDKYAAAAAAKVIREEIAVIAKHLD